MIKPIEYEQLQETLYHEKMSNGLDVYVLPKKASTRHMRSLQQSTAR